MFTRPEHSIERLSYEVLTPPAARGAISAIFWKPEISWRVHEIRVLNPIRRASLAVNEVVSPPHESTLRKGERFFADDHRSQRHMLALRDVCYVVLCDPMPRRPGAHPEKYKAQLRRRLSRGECFEQPFLGMRDFTAYFGEPTGGPEEEPIEVSEDLGLMVFGYRYREATDAGRKSLEPHTIRVHDLEAEERDGPDINATADEGVVRQTAVKEVPAHAEPEFFQARLEHGVLKVPQHLYDEIGDTREVW